MALDASAFRRRSIQPGMWVVAEDGSRLGRLYNIRQTVMEVRPGRRDPHPFAVALERIVGVGANEIRVRGAAGEVKEAFDDAKRAEMITHTLPLAAV